ncbi:hypothetical protein WSM22_31210 [Cytophagales bacterium WSM2-2]|nr:hypothetical protein WSM22_31210 [Cytophagales bacterium WSM2-2]
MKGTFSKTRWTAVTFAGWFLGVILILLLSGLLDAAGIEHMQFYLGLGMGAGVGFAQWLYLRKKSTIGKNWIWSSALGMGIPFVVMDFLFPDIGSYKLFFSVMLGALSTAVWQFSILRGHFSNVKLWVIFCFCGWFIGVATVFSVDYTNNLKSHISSNLLLALINLILILAGGVLLGIVTGIGMSRLKVES